MPRERDPAYLWDMAEAAQDILAFLGEKDFDEYIDNPLLRAAIERKIEVIGEAARKVSEEFKASHPEIPWPAIVGLRNIVAHEYDRLDQKTIWTIVTESIPDLVKLLDPLVPPLPE